MPLQSIAQYQFHHLRCVMQSPCCAARPVFNFPTSFSDSGLQAHDTVISKSHQHDTFTNMQSAVIDCKSCHKFSFDSETSSYSDSTTNPNEPSCPALKTADSSFERIPPRRIDLFAQCPKQLLHNTSGSSGSNRKKKSTSKVRRLFASLVEVSPSKKNDTHNRSKVRERPKTVVKSHARAENPSPISTVRVKLLN